MLCAAGLLAARTGTASAHPHVFVDTGIEVIFDAQGRASALRIRWHYDDLFSLLIMEDRGFDADFDGVLTDQESAALQGFDMGWDPGFAGDTYALSGVSPLILSAPQEWTADYVDGRIASTHVRQIEPPVLLSEQSLIVQVYDPGFYTAYHIDPATVLTGAAAGCSAQAFEPDLATADAILQAAIDEQAGSADVEGDFPAIGAAYSEEVRVTCPPAS